MWEVGGHGFHHRRVCLSVCVEEGDPPIVHLRYQLDEVWGGFCHALATADCEQALDGAKRALSTQTAAPLSAWIHKLTEGALVQSELELKNSKSALAVLCHDGLQAVQVFLAAEAENWVWRRVVWLCAVLRFTILILLLCDVM